MWSVDGGIGARPRSRQLEASAYRRFDGIVQADAREDLLRAAARPLRRHQSSLHPTLPNARSRSSAVAGFTVSLRWM